MGPYCLLCFESQLAIAAYQGECVSLQIRGNDQLALKAKQVAEATTHLPIRNVANAYRKCSRWNCHRRVITDHHQFDHVQRRAITQSNREDSSNRTTDSASTFGHLRAPLCRIIPVTTTSMTALTATSTFIWRVQTRPHRRASCRRSSIQTWTSQDSSGESRPPAALRLGYKGLPLLNTRSVR